MDYEKQAKAFLEETGTTLHVEYLTTAKYFPEDTTKRDIYNVSLVRGEKYYVFQFGDSIMNTEKNRNAMKRTKPSAYDILACLQKYEPEDDIDSFASTYGINEPSKAIRVYEAVKKEYEAMTKLFSEEEFSRLIEIN